MPAQRVCTAKHRIHRGDNGRCSGSESIGERSELKRAEVGDIVQMGTYEQDGDTETEDPIYWDVLDKDGDQY